LQQKKKLILIDGNALLYRSFYALPPLSTKKGIPTGGVYGFTRILMKLLREENPEYIACAFDKGKKTFRHKKWEEYKATRPKTPAELSQQITLIKEVLKGFKIPVFEDEEYEADDILATIAKEGEKAGLEVKIFTGDKDIFQVISPSIRIVRFKKGISKIEAFDTQKVKEEYGVYPEQIADYLSLAGDVSDNIPGVPGIGPKTAANLIQKFGSTEGILSNIDRLPVKLANKIKENVEKIKLSKKLATVITEIPLKIDLEKLKSKKPDETLLLNIFKELEFKELIKSIESENSEKIRNTRNMTENLRIVSHKEALSLINKTSFSSLIIWLGLEGSQWEIAIYPSNTNEETIFQINLGKNPAQSTSLKVLKEILNSKEVKKIGHDLKNIAFNLKRWGVNLEGMKFDTRIAAYLLNSSSRSYSLEEICAEFLGENTGKLSPLHKLQFIKRLYPLLQHQLKVHKMWHLLQNIEIPLIEVLVEMQARGIRVDTQLLRESLQKIRKKRIQIEEEIYNIVGEKFNINSSQQLGKILFEKFNLPPIKKTKRGYSTNEEVLRILSTMYPYLNKILEYRYLFKLESSYLKPLLDLIDPSTGRIHTCFNQTAASTGRLSSLSPNLQNIPVRENLGQEIRRSFIAGKGCILLSADYSQIELRLLAHLSQDKQLISAFIRGEDIHRETAAEIFNVLPLGVTPEMRRKAKAVNFGIIYGISPFGLARNLNIPEKEAEEYIKLYFSRYQGVKNYIEKTLKEAKTKGFTTTLMGRRRYIPLINSSNKRKRKLAERIAINSIIQGSAADLIKLAMINLHRRLKEEKLPAWIILQIHDELLLEVSRDKIHQVREIVKKEMEGAMKLSVPIVVDIRVGENWADMN